MSIVSATEPMTSAEFLALPDDGIERDLIRGQLREHGMTRRNRRHSRTTTNLANILKSWLERQQGRKGEVLTGDAAFRLSQNPDSTVGIDLAYISEELSNQSPDDAFLIDGAPVLAVEILSPSDTHKDLVDKVQLYLESGVAVIWIVDPDLQNLTVYRPGTDAMLLASSHEVIGDPELPGLRVRVADIFSR
jgi:Uma2 family endonuclease